MNTAYKHLDSKLRIAELSVGQWMAVLAGLGMAIAWGLYLSPFGPSLTLISSVYMLALPAAATLFASLTEFDAWLLVRAAIAWHGLDGRFVPGPGGSARGYRVRELEVDADSGAGAKDLAQMDAQALWEELK